jgi:DNA repair protein RecO (recombination protein O)
VPIVTTTGVVLQTHSYSDTSKILRLMTRDYGPLSAMARGALRPKSRFSGVLEPFAEGTATIYVKPNRDLHSLSDFALIRERQALGRDLHRYAGASVLCELVLRLAPQERDPHLYDLLTEGLDGLLEASEERLQSTVLAAVWQLVVALGFAPDVRSCSRCGRQLRDEAATFDIREGALLCVRCLPGPPALDAARVETLQRLVEGDVTGPRPTSMHTSLLVDFVRHHAAEGLRLRSLDFLLAEEVA